MSWLGRDLYGADQLAEAACPLLLGLAFTLMMQWRYSHDCSVLDKANQRDREDREWNSYSDGLQLESTWMDFYTTHDPVPNGPLFDYARPSKYHSVPVLGRMSTVLDHASSTYWKAPAFIQAAAELIAEPLPPAEKADKTKEANKRAAKSRSPRAACLSLATFFLTLGWACIAIDLGVFGKLTNWLTPSSALASRFCTNWEDANEPGRVLRLCTPGWHSIVAWVSASAACIVVLALLQCGVRRGVLEWERRNWQ